jgi:hypothetical protein
MGKALVGIVTWLASDVARVLSGLGLIQGTGYWAGILLSVSGILQVAAIGMCLSASYDRYTAQKAAERAARAAH